MITCYLIHVDFGHKIVFIEQINISNIS